MANTTTASIPFPHPVAESSSYSSYSLIIPVFILYVTLCNVLRFQRRDAMRKKYDYSKKPAGLSSMTNDEAQAIVSYMSELEWPYMMITSLEFALFKTYGIPTISGLLLATQELSTSKNASKRYSDTNILIGEFLAHSPSSPRAQRALARMNNLHAPYEASGKILQPDLLYTLSVFITEPPAFVSRFEWRPFTDTELCALGQTWKSVGDAMRIDYSPLSRYAGRTSQGVSYGWANGLEFAEDIKAWAQEYEEEKMVYAKSNEVTADCTTELILWYAPWWAKSTGRKFVSAVMPERLRIAMGYPKPSATIFFLLEVIIWLLKFVLTYLTLPRPEWNRVRSFSEKEDAKGRLFLKSYSAHPYYVKPTFWNRWGPEALLVRLMRGTVPGSGKKGTYHEDGYFFEEVGPKRLIGKKEALDAEATKVGEIRQGKCPFAFGR